MLSIWMISPSPACPSEYAGRPKDSAMSVFLLVHSHTNITRRLTSAVDTCRSLKVKRRPKPVAVRVVCSNQTSNKQYLRTSADQRCTFQTLLQQQRDSCQAMGSLQMRRRENLNSADLLPDYKRHHASGKQQKHLLRNAAALAGVCLVVFLFVRSSTLTASLGISAPTKGPKGPRGFTSAAGFEAAARHKQHLEEHSKDADDGSIVVDTTHGAHTADSIKPAQAMDQHSLQGEHAPKFVGGDLVDPAEPANTGANAAQHGSNAGTLDKTHPHGVYSLTAVDIDGHERNLQEFAGKVTVFVNVASKCGYTDANYKGLQKLYEKYHSSGLEILAFPCNQFGSQEPGTEAEIKQFASTQYHTTFPMFRKIDVNGASTHPVYQYLKEQLHIHDPPGLEWNFQKILVNRAGKPVLLLQQDWDQGRVEHAVYNLLVSAGVQ